MTNSWVIVRPPSDVQGKQRVAEIKKAEDNFNQPPPDIETSHTMTRRQSFGRKIPLEIEIVVDTHNDRPILYALRLISELNLGRRAT